MRQRYQPPNMTPKFQIKRSRISASLMRRVLIIYSRMNMTCFRSNNLINWRIWESTYSLGEDHKYTTMLLPSLPKNKWLAMSSWHCKCWIRYCRREKCKFPERNQCSILNPVELLMILQLPISRQQPAFVGIKGRAGKTSIPNERLRFESSTQLFCPFSVANHIGYFRQLCYANIHFLTASGRLNFI